MTILCANTARHANALDKARRDIEASDPAAWNDMQPHERDEQAQTLADARAERTTTSGVLSDAGNTVS